MYAASSRDAYESKAAYPSFSSVSDFKFTSELQFVAHECRIRDTHDSAMLRKLAAAPWKTDINVNSGLMPRLDCGFLLQTDPC